MGLETEGMESKRSHLPAGKEKEVACTSATTQRKKKKKTRTKGQTYRHPTWSQLERLPWRARNHEVTRTASCWGTAVGRFPSGSWKIVGLGRGGNRPRGHHKWISPLAPGGGERALHINISSGAYRAIRGEGWKTKTYACHR